jgi:hypothetical protein
VLVDATLRHQTLPGLRQVLASKSRAVLNWASSKAGGGLMPCSVQVREDGTYGTC